MKTKKMLNLLHKFIVRDYEKKSQCYDMQTTHPFICAGFENFVKKKREEKNLNCCFVYRDE
jgi:hypothetical protein